MGEKTNSLPTAGATQKDTVTPTPLAASNNEKSTQKDTVTPTPLDTSNDEESMDEGNDESSWHRVGRKRRHNNASYSNSPSKPEKSGKKESNSPPHHKTKKSKQINK